MKNNENITRKPEILAPAGSMEHLIYAIRAGANAIYLGTKSFNARKNAKNFGNDELIEAVRYCHERNVKLYVTLNTLVFDDEIEKLIEEIQFLALAGVDALIIQDMAVAKIVSQAAPDLAMHASTQMTIHNAEGVNAAAKMGFKRVVLARELNINEIEEIRKKTDIEIEVFVHGALCVSVSGACYLSSIIGLRSGNRGDCAQPCRLNFKSNDREYAISLKDLCAVNHIKKLSEIGVSSFKIEGRMKRPEYVALSVNAYNEALNDKSVDIKPLQDVFSRSGFTDGYLSGKRDLNMFGYRTKEDKLASAKALSKAGEVIRRERQSVPIFVDLNIDSKGFYQLKFSDKQNTFTFNGEASLSKDKPLDYDSALKTLGKMGGTPYFVKSLSFTNTANMFIPLSELNKTKRDALEKLSEKRKDVKPYDFTSSVFEKTNDIEHKNTEIRLRFNKFEQYFDQDVKHIIFPIDEIKKYPKLINDLEKRLVGEIPELVFEDNYDNICLALNELKQKGLTKVMAHNIAAIEMAKNFGFEVFGGYGLNITNSLAAQTYIEMGLSDVCLSFELSENRISKIKGRYKRGVISYGHLPLMKFRNCPIKNDETSCSSCSGNNFLTDRINIKFPLLCVEKRYTILLNSLPLYLGNIELKNTDFQVLFFTNESAEDCQKIYNNTLNKERPIQKITAGLFYRELK